MVNSVLRKYTDKEREHYLEGKRSMKRRIENSGTIHYNMDKTRGY